MKINNKGLGGVIVILIFVVINSVWLVDATDENIQMWGFAAVFDAIMIYFVFLALFTNDWQFEIEIKNPFAKSERQKEIDDKLEKLSLDIFNAKDNTEVDLILKKKEAIEAIQLRRN